MLRSFKLLMLLSTIETYHLCTRLGSTPALTNAVWVRKIQKD